MQLNDRQVEEFLDLWKNLPSRMANSEVLLNFMQQVTGEAPELGCYPGEDWMNLVQEINKTLRKWNGSLGAKDVFKYQNGQLKCRMPQTLSLFQTINNRGEGTQRQHFKEEGLSAGSDTCAVFDKSDDCVESACNDCHLKSPEGDVKLRTQNLATLCQPAEAFERKAIPAQADSLPSSIQHQAMQEVNVPLSEGLPQIGKLTPAAFATEYPEICRYFKDLKAMSPEMIWARDELHALWSGPVFKDGQLVAQQRVWFGRLMSDVATLAIRMCARLNMDLGKAAHLCMYFNSTGCIFDSWACNGLHMCLCCGSTKHSYGECQITRNLERESQKFLGSFGLYPLPFSKWAGKDLEKILVKLAESAGPEEIDPSAVRGRGSDQSTEVWTLYPEEKLDESFGVEDTHSEGEGDCAEASSTESSFVNSPHAGPEDWTMEEVAEWLWNLEGDKHRRYVETFKENLIDGRVLAELTLSDLKEDLGVRELRNRKVIYQEIQNLFH